jgi:hypothetical protein
MMTYFLLCNIYMFIFRTEAIEANIRYCLYIEVQNQTQGEF